MKRGNSAARWQARKRGHIRTSEAWTAGNRPGLARVLGFDDDVPEVPEHKCEGFGCLVCIGTPAKEPF